MLGLHVNVFIHVTLEKQGEDALKIFESAIDGRPEVMECYLMTGDPDYLLRVLVPDMCALERFILNHLTKIPGVANICAQAGALQDGVAIATGRRAGRYGWLVVDSSSLGWIQKETRRQIYHLTPCFFVLA